MENPGEFIQKERRFHLKKIETRKFAKNINKTELPSCGNSVLFIFVYIIKLNKFKNEELFKLKIVKDA